MRKGPRSPQRLGHPLRHGAVIVRREKLSVKPPKAHWRQVLHVFQGPGAFPSAVDVLHPMTTHQSRRSLLIQRGTQPTGSVIQMRPHGRSGADRIPDHDRLIHWMLRSTSDSTVLPAAWATRR
jgi:hypothetical protein